MQKFHVGLKDSSYNILFAPGLLRRLGELLRGAGTEGDLRVVAGDKIGLVSSPTVMALHGQAALESLRDAGYVVRPIEMQDREANKNLSTVVELYDACLAAELERGDLLMALGGGVVGDTAGFVAATYMRGVPYVQVPTTLLAQVDASIGGKVAVDHPHAKNIIGAFYQPKLVISDPQTLETLPPEELRCGLAEVVKAGMIRAPQLFVHLEEHGPEPLAAIVAKAIAVKVEVVVADPYERGLRAILNFGHTVGHGIEAVGNYQLRHGNAVSVGMVAATRMAVALGLCNAEVEERLTKLLTRLGLPVMVRGPSPEAVWRAMAADKKRLRGKARFVLPRAIGEVVVTDQVPEEVAMNAIASVLGEVTGL